MCGMTKQRTTNGPGTEQTRLQNLYARLPNQKGRRGAPEDTEEDPCDPSAEGCGHYSCIEQNVLSCGASGYASSFGSTRCASFQQLDNSYRNPLTRTWSSQTRSCLKTEFHRLVTQEMALVGKSTAQRCSALTDGAWDSHVLCYQGRTGDGEVRLSDWALDLTNPDSLRDLLTFRQGLEVGDVLNPRMWEQIGGIIRTMGEQTVVEQVLPRLDAVYLWIERFAQQGKKFVTQQGDLDLPRLLQVAGVAAGCLLEGGTCVNVQVVSNTAGLVVLAVYTPPTVELVPAAQIGSAVAAVPLAELANMGLQAVGQCSSAGQCVPPATKPKHRLIVNFYNNQCPNQKD
eukprot:TRINITY_DN68131_c3_g1_i2.p1 TRINITY_DN68131_c3_g1~~TRINITY_DN68131_c3_g1_i2.p1  ORF type:complete len:343 (-),score=17.22 TRINITY_DN68131_c3_g1_i2:238-1266(-)